MPKKQLKNRFFNMRVTEQEHAMMIQKAEKAGFNAVAEYILDLVRKDEQPAYRETEG